MELQGKRAGRWFRPVVDALLWFDPEHCRASYESEIGRKQLHEHYRQGSTG
jgi:putative hemolysin